MKHPSKQTLENYAARQISADEMTFVILHLEDCADCFAAVQKLVPTAEDQSVLMFAETEKFHLDYDEHLRPFVDNEADSATREIVESHTQACANCAFQLRELREFSESLRLREIEKKSVYAPTFAQKIGGWFQQFPHNLTFKIIFPLLLIVIGLAAIFLLFRQPKLEDFAKENTSVQNNLPEINQNSLISESSDRHNKSNSNQTSKNANVVEVLPKAVDETTTELADLPSDLREKILTVLNSKKLAFPAFLPTLREKLNLRGEADLKQMSLYPNGEAIRETVPNFKWKNFADSGNYTVEIFDENNQSIETSAVINGTNWTTKTKLERGKIYKWEVRSENDGSREHFQSFSGKFKILDQKTSTDLDKLSGKSPLVRGIAFASAGNLTSAEKELREAAKQKKDSQAAMTFLQQIKK